MPNSKALYKSSREVEDLLKRANYVLLQEKKKYPDHDLRYVKVCQAQRGEFMATGFFIGKGDTERGIYFTLANGHVSHYLLTKYKENLRQKTYPELSGFQFFILEILNRGFEERESIEMFLTITLPAAVSLFSHEDSTNYMSWSDHASQ